MAETKSFPTVKDIAGFLEAWAPPGSAQQYDNVGLQVGDQRQPVERALIALDVTAEVIEEARVQGATLLITHHPLIFRPLRNLTAGPGPSGLALRLARHGIALYCIHTNLDAAQGGVSFALAEQIGLQAVQFLDRFGDTLVKLVVFVPASHFDVVREALAAAGAGRIGEYDACSFAVEGTGRFRPGAAASPFIGAAGGALEAVRELRLEVEVARWDVQRVVGVLRAVHPYEEVAYDLYPVQQPSTRAGFGAIGQLEQPESLSAFLKRVCAALETRGVRYAGDLSAEVETVAVCGGSGSDLIGKAIRAGADAFVTADVTYHRFFEGLGEDGEARMALIDAGHYETEAVTERLLQQRLREQFPEATWLRTGKRTSPVSLFVQAD